MSVVVGPVPVQRLGNTLFVDTVPSRWCSYSCTYCHRERATDHLLNRSGLSDPQQIVGLAAERLAAADRTVDGIAITSEGEPTLDAHLGEVIDGLRALGKPVAVQSNGSLLTRDDVRAELGRADLVSLTFDSAREASWQAVNRPHGRLRFDLMLQGFRVFAAGFAGQLTTETMLLAGVNTSTRDLEATADFISRLEPAIAFLAVPSDRTLAAGRQGPARTTMERAAAIFSERLPHIECTAVQSAGATATDLGDKTRPFAGGDFLSGLRRSTPYPLRPLAVAKSTASGPSLAQGKLPTEAPQPSKNKGSEATGSEGR